VFGVLYALLYEKNAADKYEHQTEVLQRLLSSARTRAESDKMLKLQLSKEYAEAMEEVRDEKHQLEAVEGEFREAQKDKEQLSSVLKQMTGALETSAKLLEEKSVLDSYTPQPMSPRKPSEAFTAGAPRQHFDQEFARETGFRHDAVKQDTEEAVETPPEMENKRPAAEEEVHPAQTGDSEARTEEAEVSNIGEIEAAETRDSDAPSEEVGAAETDDSEAATEEVEAAETGDSEATTKEVRAADTADSEATEEVEAAETGYSEATTEEVEVAETGDSEARIEEVEAVETGELEAPPTNEMLETPAADAPEFGVVENELDEPEAAETGESVTGSVIGSAAQVVETAQSEMDGGDELEGEEVPETPDIGQEHITQLRQDKPYSETRNKINESGTGEENTDLNPENEIKP